MELCYNMVCDRAGGHICTGKMGVVFFRQSARHAMRIHWEARQLPVSSLGALLEKLVFLRVSYVFQRFAILLSLTGFLRRPRFHHPSPGNF